MVGPIERFQEKIATSLNFSSDILIGGFFCRYASLMHFCGLRINVIKEIGGQLYAFVTGNLSVSRNEDGVSVIRQELF